MHPHVCPPSPIALAAGGLLVLASLAAPAVAGRPAMRLLLAAIPAIALIEMTIWRSVTPFHMCTTDLREIAAFGAAGLALLLLAGGRTLKQ